MQVRFGLSRAVFRGSRTGLALCGSRACARPRRESRSVLTGCVLFALFLLIGCGGQGANAELDTEIDVPDDSTGGDSLSVGSGSTHHDEGAGGQTHEGGAAGSSGGGDAADAGPWIDERDLAEVNEVSGRYHMVSQLGDYMLIDGDVEIFFGGTPEQFSWHLCNEYWGDYEILDGRLVTGSFEATLAGCDFAVGGWEGWLVRFFEAEPMIRSEGDNLVVMSEQTQLVFAPGGGPPAELLPAPLEETVWTVTSLAANPDGVAYVWHYHMPNPDFFGSIVFAAGTVTVTGPCNVGTGRYSMVESAYTLNIEEMGWTKAACTDPDASRREQVLVQLFEGEPLQYGVYDQSLTLDRSSFMAGPAVSYALRARAHLD